MKIIRASFGILAITMALAVQLQAQDPFTNTLGLYPGVTISGGVGFNYTIESTSVATNTNPWVSVATLTLAKSPQLWVDSNVNATLPGNPPTYLRVVSGTQNVASYDGCDVFTAGDYYNNDIYSEPLDPNSATYISSIAKGSPGGFYFSEGLEFVNLAVASTPRVAVSPQVTYHANEFAGVAWPWSASFWIEPASDKHAIVLDTVNHLLFETYGSVTTSNGGLSAYSGGHWDLSQPIPVGQFKPSDMASGLSMFAGAIKWPDLETGVINHALNFFVQADAPCNCSVAPADDTDGLSGPANGLPYGAHLRLRANFPVNGLNTQQLAVVHALQHYGMFLADTGNSGNGFYTVVPPDENDGHYQLGTINFTLTNFDVVPSSTPTASVVSVGLYPGVTVYGVVGSNYIIQSTADLSGANSWVAVTNLTLTQPEQLWVDTNINASLPANAEHFYRVLPAP